MVHHLAAAPLLGRVLLAQERDRFAKTVAAMDVLVATAVPMLLGKSMPAVINSATMAYGLAQARAPKKATRIAVLMALLIGVLHPVKEIVRHRFFGREPFHRNGEPAAQYRQYDSAALVDARGWIPRWFARTDRFVDLAYVMSQTPSVVPFLGWRRYARLPLGLIPRLLWPAKPAEASGQDYGHRYGFLEPDDTEHSVTMPVIVEAWATAGWAGVVLSAVCWAGLLRLLWTARPGVLGMALVNVAANAENTLGLTAIGVVHRWMLYRGLDALIMRRSVPWVSNGHLATR